MSWLVVTGLESRVANCVAVAAWPAPPLYRHTLITWPHLLKMPASFALFFYQYLPHNLVLCLYFPKPNGRSWIGMRINEGRSRRALCWKHIWNVLIYGSFFKISSLRDVCGRRCRFSAVLPSSSSSSSACRLCFPGAAAAGLHPLPLCSGRFHSLQRCRQIGWNQKYQHYC